MVDEPQALLGKRQRHHRGPLSRHHGLASTAIPGDAERQLANRGRVKQGWYRELGIEAGVDHGDQARRQQRVATKIEEGLVDADAVDAEDLGERAGQDLFDRVGRRAITGALVFGCGQGAGIEFAVDRQRQRLQDDHRARHHIFR